MSSLQVKLQHKYALSEKGAKDMIKAFISVTCSNLVLMFPVWMLYFLIGDYLQGTMAGRGVFYICLLYTSPSPRDPKTSRMPSSA